MKKKIFVSIFILLIFIFCSGFSFSPKEEEQKEAFSIEVLEKFEDKNIKEYTLMDLEILILEQKNIQSNAHELAESARNLGWPEDSEPILLAQIEWSNAQIIIDYYQKAYDERYAAIEKERWENKKSQYPEATEVWLFMKEQGWNDYVCAGIMGNLMSETGGHTLNLNPKLKHNGYYGICQWSKTYKGVWGKNLSKQLEYLKSNIEYEINTYGYAYKKGFDFEDFLALTDEKEVALAFAKTYERCAAKTYKVRQDDATKAYNYFIK